MKRYLLIILVAIVSFLGLTTGVSADEPPKTFPTKDVIKLEEYVPGLEGYYKPIDGGLEVFCEDAGLTYVTGVTYKLKGQVHDGYIYIFEHRPNTGNKYKDYYIQNIAIWWFKDYLNGNHENIKSRYKQYIIDHSSTDTVCKLIYELVEGAKRYKQEKGSISLDSNAVTWTLSGDNYISSTIKITGKALTSGSISLSGAPTGTKLINSTVDKTGNGTFQIQVPKSSITAGQTYSFTIKAAGKYKIKRMYDYYLEKNPDYQGEYQQVIYGQVFTTTYDVSASKTVTIAINSNKLSITKIDKETNAPLAGATLTLYKGDCSNSACSNPYSKWTTTASAKVFNNIPVGDYTLVETAAPEGYLVANKQVIHITSANGTYNVTMADAKAHNQLTIIKVDKETNAALAGAVLTLYKGDCTKSTCSNPYSKWTTTTSGKVFKDIPVGEYTLVETTTPDGYLTAEKMLVKITSNNATYSVKMEDARAHNKLSILKVDQAGNTVIGAGLTLYKGDCTKTTCTDKFASWTTNGSAREFGDIAIGLYTLVETTTPAGYKTAAKMLININSKNGNFPAIMVDEKINSKSVRISKTDVTGQKEIPGASLVLRDANNNIVDQWVSQSTPHYTALVPGEYFLKETIAPAGYILSTDTINFKVDAEGNIFQKASNGSWVKVDYIKMINESKNPINISKLDSETNEYVVGAKLRIKNEKGEIVATWTTTRDSYYLSLEDGIYILEEVSAPKGYIINNKPIYFRVDANSNVYTADANGHYSVKVNGIIMYDKPEEIIIPATGLSSTLTYALGTLVLGFGAMMLYRNEKQC